MFRYVRYRQSRRPEKAGSTGPWLSAPRRAWCSGRNNGSTPSSMCSDDWGSWLCVPTRCNSSAARSCSSTSATNKRQHRAGPVPGGLPELLTFTTTSCQPRRIVEAGIVHGDLSAYNLLVWHGRLVVIDFPQAVDPVLNPDGLALLQRDVLNTRGWFSKKGLTTDRSAILGDLMAHLF